MYRRARNLVVDLYRRDVRRRLTFADVRRHVAGDAAALQRVFEFLEEWGLVNFQAPGGGGAADADFNVAPDGACPGHLGAPLKPAHALSRGHPMWLGTWPCCSAS